MSEFKFSCPHCNQHIQCDESYGGAPLQCPSCHTEIRIPKVGNEPEGPVALPTPPRPVANVRPSPVSPAPRQAKPVKLTIGLLAFVLLLLSAVPWIAVYVFSFVPILGRIPLVEFLVLLGGAIFCGRFAREKIGENPSLAENPAAQWGVFFSYLAVSLAVILLPAIVLRLQLQRMTSGASGKAVVVATKNTPAVFVETAPSGNQFAKISIQNPERALTFVFELRKTLDEYYQEHKYFRWGNMAKIYFDTDTNESTGGADDTNLGNRGFEFRATVDFAMSYGAGALASWSSPAPWMGKPKEHLPTCRIETYDTQRQGFSFRGPGVNMVARELSRAKVDGKMVYVTVNYDELHALPGQRVRLAILDCGSSSGDGQFLRERQIQLK